MKTRRKKALDMESLVAPYLAEYRALIRLERSKRKSRKVQPTHREFIWETDDGERIPVSKMATPHLFYAARMLFNHTVPPAFRVGRFARRAGVREWDVNYKTQAYNALVNELRYRKDFDTGLGFELADMDENRAFLQECAENLI